jgi:hypothetical protein
MSVTAKSLARRGERTESMTTAARDQLAMIDEKLQGARSALGRNLVQYRLPGNLLIPGVDKMNMQRVLYSSVITSLEERGFEVRIATITDDGADIEVAWISELDPEDVQAMDALIQSHHRPTPRPGR